MLSRFRPNETFCFRQVNQIQDIAFLAFAYDNVLGTDISVQEVVSVEVMQPLKQLYSNLTDSIYGELSPDEITQLPEIGSVDGHCHASIIAIYSVPVYARDALLSPQLSPDHGLVLQIRRGVVVVLFQLDRYALVRPYVLPCIHR